MISLSEPGGDIHQTENSLSSIAERLRESVSLKMAVVGFLILILLIPVAMLRGLVEERSQLRETAAADIMRGWGGPQLVAGPVLMIPARVVTNDSHSRRVTEKYAVLFIGLSFVAYFLFETMGRLQLHPMQYLLVGFANRRLVPATRAERRMRLCFEFR